MILRMQLIQIGYNFVFIDIVDHFKTLPSTLDSNSEKFNDCKSYKILFFKKDKMLKKYFIIRYILPHII